MDSFSVWHWMIVLSILAGVALAVLYSRRTKTVIASGGAAVLSATAEPSGLRGWLVLMVIGQVGGVLRFLKSIMDDIDLFKTPNVTSDGEVAIYVELALNVAVLALVVVTTVMMFRKSRWFPSLWIWQGAAAVSLPFVDAILVANILKIQVSQVLDEKTIGQAIGSAIAVGIWIWYLRVSMRVRNTFVN